jgi:hypothetical protein
MKRAVSFKWDREDLFGVPTSLDLVIRFPSSPLRIQYWDRNVA